jgi:DNA-binding protein HU-beta
MRRRWRGIRAEHRKGKGRVHKNEFIRQVAKEVGLPQTMVSQVLSAAVRVIARSLIAGQKVVWTGFGTFEMRQRSQRRGINPQTRERIVIDATNTPGFTASSAFKERVLTGDEGTDDGDEGTADEDE